MARREAAEIENIHRLWKEKIFQPEFREMSFTDQGKELGVSGQTISNWRKAVKPERWQQILDMTRKDAALPTLEVDDALLRTAKSGDVPAMKLWYEIHGWSPKQNVEVTRGQDKELDPGMVFEVVKEALKNLTPEQKAEVTRMAQETAVLEAKSDSEGVEGGPHV